WLEQVSLPLHGRRHCKIEQSLLIGRTNLTDTTASPKLRIVIADDEPIIRLDLKKMLEDTGFDVVSEAGDGAKAVEAARTLNPDIVILDIKMPNMDGIDAAKVINEEKIAPVLLLTAYSQVDLVKRAKEAGVYSYLVKPFKEADLLPAIEIAMSRWE